APPAAPRVRGRAVTGRAGRRGRVERGVRGRVGRRDGRRAETRHPGRGTAGREQDQPSQGGDTPRTHRTPRQICTVRQVSFVTDHSSAYDRISQPIGCGTASLRRMRSNTLTAWPGASVTRTSLSYG